MTHDAQCEWQYRHQFCGCAERAVSETVARERAIIWLAAQMTVALMAEDVERVHEGDFKTGMQFACEEIATRLEMESRGEKSVTRNGEDLSAAAIARAERALAQAQAKVERIRELWRMYKATLPGVNARDYLGLCIVCGRKIWENHSEHCYLALMDAALTEPGGQPPKASHVCAVYDLPDGSIGCPRCAGFEKEPGGQP